MRIRKYFKIIATISLIASLSVVACSTAKTIGSEQSATITLHPPDNNTGSKPTPSPADEPKSILPIENIFRADSPICQPETASGAFAVSCSNDTLTIKEEETRRKVDILTQREVSFKYSGPFSIQAEIESIKSMDSQVEENQYGLIIIDGKGDRHVLRIQGQYFDWETWSVDGDSSLIERSNLSFSPFLKPGDQSNTLDLVCLDTFCDLTVNDEFTARLSHQISWGIYGLGIFTASDWDESFGSVKFNNFDAKALTAESTDFLYIADRLTQDSGIFSQMGLSGAYASFEADGFHFSPVIPYGFYAVKANPSLSNAAISATLVMEIDPGTNSSQYGGLICRSSQEGMYMAVIRADGSYSIYRDTPQRNFALLAQRTSDHIKTGRAENDIRLECVQDQVHFSINGEMVETLTDSRFGLNFGRMGFFTKAGGSPGPDAIIFRDLRIEEVRQ